MTPYGTELYEMNFLLKIRRDCLFQTSGVKSHKESAEMAAWLRRKDYNPMKAAAEAKKLQQLKTR